jgi:5'-deoxynucleotidase YfbR-like HD superfamily hydrolase
VAEHCCWVYEEMREAGIGEEDVLRAGFLHDASEAYLVDVPAPVKNLPAMKPYRDAEDRIQVALGERYGFDLFDPETAQVVKRYDKAAYVFETKFVRTGIVSGLSPAEALSDWRGIATNLGLDVL